MAYSVEEVNSCTKKIVFNYENLDLSDLIKLGLKEKQQKASLKGFRPGKAPWAVIEKLYRPEVEADTLNRFVQDEYYKAVSEQNLRVIGLPAVSNLKYASGTAMSFDALVEVIPEVHLPEYSHWTFQQEAVEVTPEEISSMLKMQLEYKATMEVLTDPEHLVAKGDFVIINFVGEQEDGTRPDSMQAKEHQLEIGSGQFIPGFEEQLLGMKAGEKKDFQVQFPTDYHVENLRNRPVKFEVELLEIKEKKLPVMTDDLAGEMGFDTVDAWTEDVRANLLNQKERKVLENLHQQIIEKFIQEISLPDIPRALLQQQEETLKGEVAKSLERNGYGPKAVKDYFAKWSEELQQKALFQIRSGLILNQLADKLQVQVRPEDLDTKLAAIASGYGVSKEQIKSIYAEGTEAYQNIYYALREEKTMAVIKAQMNITQV